MNVLEVEEDGGNRKGKNCNNSLGSFLSLLSLLACPIMLVISINSLADGGSECEFVDALQGVKVKHWMESLQVVLEISETGLHVL